MNKSVGELQQFMSPFTRKIAIVALYALIILVALYSPLVFDYFSTGKTLNVCTFTETFSTEAIEQFEEETGIKVNLTYVELDEQIFAKFKINEGQGYDVVNVSDFMVERLATLDLLQPLNLSLIKNFTAINPRLLDQQYDPKNRFSIPHKWFMYGLIYDKNFFAIKPDLMSLDFIFQNPEELAQKGLVSDAYKICMIDSPLDAFFLAARYLFGYHENLTDDECEKIRDLLIAQKKWVESYTLYSIQYFLFTDVVPIALTASNFIRKIWDESSRFDFSIPKEGGILVIENLVVPKHSQKAELAHQFIDFMTSEKIAQLNAENFGWAPANDKANTLVDKAYAKASHLFLNDHTARLLHIPLYPWSMRTKIDDIWLGVGFA